MKGRLVTARGNGAGDQAFGFLGAARLVGDQTQQMQAVGIVRFALQKLAGFRGGGGSSLQVGKRVLQKRRDGDRWRGALAS